jgi:hypothetical protein
MISHITTMRIISKLHDNSNNESRMHPQGNNVSRIGIQKYIVLRSPLTATASSLSPSSHHHHHHHHRTSLRLPKKKKRFRNRLVLMWARTTHPTRDSVHVKNPNPQKYSTQLEQINNLQRHIRVGNRNLNAVTVHAGVKPHLSLTSDVVCSFCGWMRPTPDQGHRIHGIRFSVMSDSYSHNDREKEKQKEHFQGRG